MENLNQKLEAGDDKLVSWAARVALPFARAAIFIVYFYFGALKVFSAQGAANPLVLSLLDRTLGGVSPELFLIAFGVFEMIIGILFLMPHLERLGIFLLIIHLLTTILPLFILPEATWAGFLVPTLEGQYIIKNVLIIALALGILSRLRPLRQVA